MTWVKGSRMSPVEHPKQNSKNPKAVGVASFVRTLMLSGELGLLLEGFCKTWRP